MSLCCTVSEIWRDTELVEMAIVWRYLRDVKFSRFGTGTIPACDGGTDGKTDRHTTTAYTALA